MKRIVLSGIAAVAAFAAQPAAAAATLLTPGCNLSVGCKFSGNDNPVADVVAAYNGQTPAPSPALSLTFLSKLEGSSISGTSGVATSSTPFNFYVVKAGTEFWLYKLAAPATQIAWNTSNLTNDKGKARDISHLSFYNGSGGVDNFSGGAVPEPATWAMMIGGLGAVGFSLRRGRKVVAA